MSAAARRGVALLLAIVTLLLLSLRLSSRAPTALPLVIVVSPTHDRLTRYADTLHLQLTLQAALSLPQAPRIEWLLVEDGPLPDPAILSLLHRSNIPHHYFHQLTPPKTEHRGLAQRNRALDLIRRKGLDGIVYFADDDNALRPELLSELARIPKDSYTIFPVGNTGYFGFEGPVLVAQGSSSTSAEQDDQGAVQIQQWCCDFCRRRWNVDMGGLAFHSSLLHSSPPLAFNPLAEAGFLETDLLEQFEALNATLTFLPRLMDEVHVWHDHSVPFYKAGFYDQDWRTEGVLSRKLMSKNEVARGFSWANNSLPVGRML
ncbi:nucleotide-diphospho-sugar transferase [Leucosporidium creatinivorum]|uniref:Nucleotide-diphospho-sugar transferase n=1 Tax=Leucosporidium creatinivorum TaxID=106004 RepID=A0A1Y2FBH1_9BASI|nr:nucleotide-diphospho-sugar transferase [Leucosporidium creatinivorum]